MSAKIAIAIIYATYLISFLAAMVIWGDNTLAILIILFIWSAGLIVLVTNEKVELWLKSFDGD